MNSDVECGVCLWRLKGGIGGLMQWREQVTPGAVL
jgi:hypothetical protein